MKWLIAGSLAALLTVATATPIFSAACADPAKSENPISDVVDLLLKENPSPETRRGAAELIAKTCSAYLPPLSALSPKDSAQFDAEMKSNRADRITGANQSFAYSQRYVMDHVGDCIGFATSLASGTDKRNELTDWVGLSVVLLDWELVWHIRNLARLDVARYTRIQLIQANDLSWVGQLIVQNIVYPEVRGLDH